MAVVFGGGMGYLAALGLVNAESRIVRRAVVIPQRLIQEAILGAEEHETAIVVGAAVQRPVVEDREPTVDGSLDVEFDRFRSVVEGGCHGGNRVLEITVFRR